MIVPYLFMPAKDPAEVVSFFDQIVQDGRLKVINAEERPDVWDRVEPCDDVRLIVGNAEMVPPEGTDIARVLTEFRPEPDAETQFNSWTDETESEPTAEAEQPVDDNSPIEDNSSKEELAPADALVSSGSPVVDDVPTDGGSSAMDKPWTSFTSRGFKG